MADGLHNYQAKISFICPFKKKKTEQDLLISDISINEQESMCSACSRHGYKNLVVRCNLCKKYHIIEISHW